MAENSLSVVILEDEPIWQKHLQLHLQNLGYTVAACYDNVESAIINLHKVQFDIALIDIHLHGNAAGIEVGRFIKTSLQKPFIFVTSSIEKNTISDALGAKPSSYLIKPITEASLYVAIQTAIENFQNNMVASGAESNANANSFFIKVGTTYKKLFWSDIIALAVDGRYTRVILKNDDAPYLISSSLQKTINSLLPKTFQTQFIQINRNEYINYLLIKSIDSLTVKIMQHSFTVSEIFSKQLKTKLNIVN